jgi:glycerophosphoryl diester phosphodiesterase
MPRLALGLLTTLILIGSASAWAAPPAASVAEKLSVPKHFINYGHRGDSHHWPENTVAAMKSALEHGANAVEIDLRKTRDGRLVSFHDGDVRRTTDAEEVFPDRAKQGIGKFTLAELKQLDAGSWKDERFAGHRIPTLAEVLEAVKGRGVMVFDVKEGNTAETAAKIIAETGFDPRQIIVFAWNGKVADEYQTHLPKTTLLAISGDVPKRYDDAFLKAQKARGVEGFSVSWKSLAEHPDFVSAVHRHGMIVHVWTVNNPAQLRAAVLAGVDGVGTDVPGVLAEMIAVEE